jgi:hypothetical protein
MTVPADIVRAFVAKLEISLWQLRTHTVGVARSSPVAPLTASTQSGRTAQSGRLGDWGTFQLHGVGCLIQLETGEEVDFDWDAEGRAIFDRWRLRQFARSAGHEHVSAEALVEAARQLASNGLLVETPEGWFRVP